jgi:dephospho-CoA kinase
MIAMKNAIILVSGMPGTGKTSFADWLSATLTMPLICYDRICVKTIETAKKYYEDEEQRKLLNVIPYEFFLFMCEELMKTSSPLIAEYLFSVKMNELLDGLMKKYHYTTITVHMDASTETAYNRFINRKRQNPEDFRPSDITLEKFTEFTKQNKDFRYGDYFISVDTDDFSAVSYDDIAAQVKKHITKVIT